jgi:hypothetical protein
MSVNNLQTRLNDIEQKLGSYDTKFYNKHHKHSNRKEYLEAKIRSLQKSIERIKEYIGKSLSQPHRDIDISLYQTPNNKSIMFESTPNQVNNTDVFQTFTEHPSIVNDNSTSIIKNEHSLTDATSSLNIKDSYTSHSDTKKQETDHSSQINQTNSENVVDSINLNLSDFFTDVKDPIVEKQSDHVKIETNDVKNIVLEKHDEHFSLDKKGTDVDETIDKELDELFKN